MTAVDTTDALIGSRLFSDGSTRPVYQDHEGRYVFDDAGGIVRGQWLWREDDGTDSGDWCDVSLIVDAVPEP